MFVAFPFNTFEVIFVIFISQLLEIFDVPLIFSTVLNAAYPTAINNTTAHNAPIIIFLFFLFRSCFTPPIIFNITYFYI